MSGIIDMTEKIVNQTIHTAVLPREAIDSLCLEPSGIIIDGTLGGGGHTRMIAEAVGKEGLVIGLDRDPLAIARCERSPVSYTHLTLPTKRIV